MKAVVVFAALLLSQTAPTIRPGTLTTGDIASAVGSLPRFTPDRFVALPPTVREAFTAINCQVPQTALSGGPMNVIAGEFAAKGQRDWAALCSNGMTTEIRVVWGGAGRCEDRLSARQDSDTLRERAAGVFEYDRTITVGVRGSQDVIAETINGVTVAHACVGSHWQSLP